MPKNPVPIAISLLASLFLIAATLLGTEGKPPDMVVLKGSPLGGVRFDHKMHAERAGRKCETCHHPSKPEKPLSAPQQACFDCHTSPPTAAVKVSRQGAFHTPTATSGTCIDCHKAQNAKGMKAPTKCMDCHKKTNI